MEETLHCENCKKDFTRIKARGRKPRLCPTCLGAGEKPVKTEKVADAPTKGADTKPDKISKVADLPKVDFEKLRAAKLKSDAKIAAKRRAEEEAQDKIDRKIRAGKYTVNGKKYTILPTPVKVGDIALYVPTSMYPDFSKSVSHATEVKVFGVDSAGAMLIQFGPNQVPCRPNKLYKFK